MTTPRTSETWQEKQKSKRKEEGEQQDKLGEPLLGLREVQSCSKGPAALPRDTSLGRDGQTRRGQQLCDISSVLDKMAEDNQENINNESWANEGGGHGEKKT